jgi:hypothetical protein
MGELKSSTGLYGEENNLLPLPEIEKRFLVLCSDLKAGS